MFSDQEIDTTLNLISGRVQQSLLFAEIRLPMNGQNDEKTLELAERLSNTIKSEGAFGAAARRYSRSPSRARSGRMDWLPVGTVCPPALAGQIMALAPGEVTAPIVIGPTVGLFQLRGLRKERNSEQGPVSVTYVSVNVPGEPGSDRLVADATKLINDVDTCDDIRAQSERFAIPGHTDHVEEVGNLPSVVAVEMAGLDRHEASYYTNSAGTLTIVMLCDRFA